MTPLRAALARIGWSAPELARRLGRNLHTVNCWVYATRSRHGTPTATPPAVLEWVQRVAEAVDGVPWRS